MQQMNDWLDQEQSGHFSSLLQVESEFIEVGISAKSLIKAIRSDKKIENYDNMVAVFAMLLDEKLKLFEEMMKRRDERFKALNTAMSNFEESGIARA